MNSLFHGSATQGRDESDAELLERVKSGDTKAFGRIYDRHCQAAYGLARRYCRAPSDAEEVVQDAFLSVWRNAHRFDPDRGSGRTWILGIVANRAVDELRRSSRRRRYEQAMSVAPEPVATSPSTDELVQRGELRRVVHDVVMNLPSAQRRAVALAHLAGLSHSEVAIVTGDPLGTVKSRLRLGHARMRAALGDVA